MNTLNPKIYFKEMECPYKVSNSHLYQMLVHRKNKDYPRAYQELKLACEEGDVEAIGLACCIRKYGGLGLPHKWPEDFIIPSDFRFESIPIVREHPDSSNDYSLIVQAVAEKSVFGPVFFYRQAGYVRHIIPEYTDYVDLCCKWNDPFMLYLRGGVKNFQKCVDQMFTSAIVPLIELYYERLEYLKAAKVIVLRYSPFMIYKDIEDALHKRTGFERTEQCFVFGKWLVNQRHSQRSQPIFANSMRIYRETIDKTFKATQFWMFAAKELGVCRDVAKMIGRLIWDTREDPVGWKIGIKRELPERKRRKIKF